MKSTRRRSFLKAAGLGVAALALGTSSKGAESRRLVVGVIGTGGMGTHHVSQLAARKDIEVAFLCDVDQNRLASAAQIVTTASGKAPKGVKDLREALDDRNVDALLVAAP